MNNTITQLAKDVYCIDILFADTVGMASSFVIKGNPWVLIDGGTSYTAPLLLKALKDIDIPLNDEGYIVLTHAHVDHAGGLAYLLTDLPKAMVITHPGDFNDLMQPQQLIQSVQRFEGIPYGEMKPLPREKLIAAQDGKLIDLGTNELELLEVPGHDRHHFAAFLKQGAFLFGGDAPGIYDKSTNIVFPLLPPLNPMPEAYLESLNKMKSVSPKEVCFGHFGSVSTENDIFSQCAEYFNRLADTVDTMRNHGGNESEIAADIMSWFSHLDEIPPLVQMAIGESVSAFMEKK